MNYDNDLPLKLFNSPTQQCSSLRLIIVIISFFLNPNSSSSCLSKSKNVVMYILIYKLLFYNPIINILHIEKY